MSRAVQEDIGQRFETAVYLELCRRNRGKRTEVLVSYTVPKSDKKVDFLVGDALAAEPYQLIQATLSLGDPKTRKREMGSLAAAMRATGVREGLIVSLREQEDIDVEGEKVRVIPAWQWFTQADAGPEMMRTFSRP